MLLAPVELVLRALPGLGLNREAAMRPGASVLAARSGAIWSKGRRGGRAPSFVRCGAGDARRRLLQPSLWRPCRRADGAGTSQVNLLVATTRAPVLDPPGVMFGGARGKGLDFADIAVSIPPAGVASPATSNGRAVRPAIRNAISSPCAPTGWTWPRPRRGSTPRVAQTPGHKVLIFVHGYNTRFEEAVYRFAQIVHDARRQRRAGAVHLALAAATCARLCLRSRQRHVFARRVRGGAAGARRRPERRLDLDPRPFDGQLRRRRGAAADGDPRPRPAVQDQGRHARLARHRRRRVPPPDRRDRRRAAADASSRCSFRATTRRSAFRASSPDDSTRLGALDPTQEPYPDMLETGAGACRRPDQRPSNDAANHSKFATGEVVPRSATGWPRGRRCRTPSPGLVESLGAFTKGAVNIAADVAVGTVTAPVRLTDPTREREVGRHRRAVRHARQVTAGGPPAAAPQGSLSATIYICISEVDLPPPSLKICRPPTMSTNPQTKVNDEGLHGFIRQSRDRWRFSRSSSFSPDSCICLVIRC